MWGRVFGVVAAIGLVGLALIATLAPARATQPPPPPDTPAIHEFCFASGDLSTSFADIQGPATKWDCDRRDLTIAPERIFLKFSLPADKPLPRFLNTRRGALGAIHVMAVDRDGAVRTRDYTLATAEPAFLDAFFKVRLPDVSRDTESVIVAIDKPTFLMTLSLAHLGPGDPGFGPGNIEIMLLLAAICGMMTMPLVFNVAYYRVLRERFVLWHSSLVFFFFLTVLLHSGLWSTLVTLNIAQVSALSTIVLGLAVGSAGMFAYHFIEPGRLNPRLRRALPWASQWAVAVSLIHALFPFVLRPLQTDIYFAAYIPVLALHIAMLCSALMRGSRAAKFQLVGWSALILVGVARLVGQLTPLMSPTDAMPLFYFGVLVEAIATALGVADRFLAMKDQRDRATTEAQMLERLTECDPLTGLLNRRAIDDRFALLRSDGFTTLALLDLDRFKSVNDEYGHGVGDEVLKATAKALSPDTDTLVFRLGGEEFVLLLKGKNTFAEAERRRQAITTVIAREVPGLAQPITASMGMIDVPVEVAGVASFAELYQRADFLLYEAKQSGRNRTMSERLSNIAQRKRKRRRRPAAA